MHEIHIHHLVRDVKMANTNVKWMRPSRGWPRDGSSSPITTHHSKLTSLKRRIEDLTNQLSNVQRALAFEQLADVPIRTAEPQPFTSRAISMSSTTPSDQTSTLLSIQQIPETSISADDSVMDALWFDRNSMATVQDHPTYWTLDRVMVEHHIIVDLFQQ
jgi:hypothetical protein